MSQGRSTFTKIKLPQLNMETIKKRKDKTASMCSLKQLRDSTFSPRKTRTDFVSRGSMSTTPIDPKRQNYYNFRNMVWVEQSFRDTDIYQQQQTHKLGEQLKRINDPFSRVRARDPRKTAEPYMPTTSPKRREKSTKRKEIKDKVSELFDRVQDIVKQHKGYIRQIDKKQLHIKWVQLKKEFQAMNQDYNDYYVADNTKIMDLHISSHFDVLRKLFEQQQQQSVRKRNGQQISLFEYDDVSVHIPTDIDQIILTEEIQEQEQSQEESIHINQPIVTEIESQRTDQTSEHSIFSGRKVSIKKRQTTIKDRNTQQTIDLNQVPSTPRRKSIKLTDNSVSSVSSFNDPRKNRFSDGTPISAKLRLDSPKQTPKNAIAPKVEILESKEEILRRQASKRTSKLVTRRGTSEYGQSIQEQGRMTLAVHEVIRDETEFEVTSERQRLSEETKSLEHGEHGTNRDEITNRIEELLDNTVQNTVRNAVFKQIVSNGIINALIKGKCIYDMSDIDLYRKVSIKNTWMDDTEYIIKGEYQFC